jgi:flavin-dependent dehydrogenase
MPTTRNRHDAVVIGARCAGAATAMLLARAGHDVVVVDRAHFPSDTLSTHGLVRGGVVQLSRWGLLDEVLATGTTQVREVAFHRDGDVVRRAVKGRAGVDLLVAPRRTALDAVLVGAARRAGAVVHEGVSATGLLRDSDGRVRGVTVRGDDFVERELRASYVVGADGLRSRTARWVEAPVIDAFPSGTSLYCSYVGGGPWAAYEFHVAPGSFAGVFPTNDGLASVWLCRPTALLERVRSAGRRRDDAFLEELDAVAPDLGARVRAGRLRAPVRGAVGLPNHVRQATGPGWALVGDAGYHRDPITGHGITDAFRDAELLADALREALAAPADEAAAMRELGARRDAALCPTWHLTRALARFPGPERFVELQVQLSDELDREAMRLAALPPPPGRAASAA